MSISDITFNCNLHSVRLNDEYESIYEPIEEDGRIIGYRHMVKPINHKYTDEEIIETVLKHFKESIYRLC